MRIRKKSLPRCRYQWQEKTANRATFAAETWKKEYDNGNNDHREQRLPPARGEDREDNRLRGGISEPGGNGAQTAKEEAESPAAKGRRADPKWMTREEVSRDAGRAGAAPRDGYRQAAYHSLFHDRARTGRPLSAGRRSGSLRERWMVETPAAKVDRMIAEHPLHNRKNGSYGKKGRDTGKNQ